MSKKQKENRGNKTVSWPVLAVFLVVGFVFIAQMIWWIIFFLGIVKDTEGDKYSTMIIYEGGSFIMLIVVGMIVIYRILYREIRLKQQFKDFFAAFSHELKTPIASVRLQTETMLSHDLPKEKSQELMGNMLSDVEKLEVALDNILDVFRYESGSIHLDTTPVEFDQWVREKTDYFLQYNKSERVNIDLNLESNAVVEMDDRYFNSVIMNLFQNSLRYCQKGTVNIKIQSSIVDKRLVFEYEDDGIGIDADEVEEIFRKFYRSDKARYLQHKGSGVGLFLTREIVEKHDGTIRAEGRGENQGILFVMVLPTVKDNE